MDYLDSCICKPHYSISVALRLCYVFYIPVIVYIMVSLQISQLKHDVSMKDALLRIYVQDYDLEEHGAPMLVRFIFRY